MRDRDKTLGIALIVLGLDLHSRHHPTVKREIVFFASVIFKLGRGSFIVFFLFSLSPIPLAGPRIAPVWRVCRVPTSTTRKKNSRANPPKFPQPISHPLAFTSQRCPSRLRRDIPLAEPESRLDAPDCDPIDVIPNPVCLHHAYHSHHPIPPVGRLRPLR